MSQSSALLAEDLSEEAATIADASLIVRARFVEAADTMAHMDVGKIRPATARSFWPEIQPHSMDQVEIIIRYRPSAAAISRAEEVMYGWLLDFVHDDERRILLGKWSMCLAAPHIAGSFREFCKKSGRVRRTAERRLTREFQNVADALLKNAQSLQEPNWSRVSPMLPDSATDLDRMREPVARSPGHWRDPEMILVSDPESQARKALIKRMEKANRQREARQKRSA